MTSDGGVPGSKPPAHPKTSYDIAKLAAELHGKDVPVEVILAALKDRGFGVLMILFALPNAVIPGLSFILGAPVLLIALQLAYGKDEVWLPGFIRRRVIPGALFEKIASRTERFLVWIERHLRSRWTWLLSRRAQRFLGIFIAVVAAALMMPIPFGNLLPALGISLIAAGLIGQDGKAAAIGIGLGILGALYIAAAIAIGIAAFKGIMRFI